MGVNRVDFGDKTIIDISDSTVTEETLAKGSTAYGADGEQIQGQAEFGGDTSDCYKTTDEASTVINDTDYVPLSNSTGTTKKKSTWSNIKTVLSDVFALKNHTVITGSLSLGRKADGTRGTSSFAIGNAVTASGNYSHAEGDGTTASGYASHAEGDGTTASGYASHSEGFNTIASKDYSHAEGGNTEASYLYTHAEGYDTTASNSASHAEGYSTTASGYISHAEGFHTEASGSYQHVQGKYNIEDTQKYAHIVGNGDASKRSNAHTLDWNGNAWFAGDVESATAGKLSEQMKHHFGIIQTGYASSQYKVVSDLPSYIVPEDGGQSFLFKVKNNDLITVRTETTNSFSASDTSPIYLVIDGVNYKIVYNNNDVISGTNNSYYGNANRNITYRLDTVNHLAHFFAKDWDNNTTYNFKTSYNASTNKAVTESDLNTITSGLGTSVSTDSGNVNIGTGAWTQLEKVTIPKGVYSISTRIEFSSTSANDIRANVATVSGSSTTANTLGNGTMYGRSVGSSNHANVLNLCCCESFDKSTSIYVNVWHNNGSNLQCRVWINATKIANL